MINQVDGVMSTNSNGQVDINAPLQTERSSFAWTCASIPCVTFRYDFVETPIFSPHLNESLTATTLCTALCFDATLLFLFVSDRTTQLHVFIVV